MAQLLVFLGKIIFMSGLAVLTALVSLAGLTLKLLFRCQDRTVIGATMCLGHLANRFWSRATFWISIQQAPGAQRVWEDALRPSPEAPLRPVVVLVNHSTFYDLVLTAIALPAGCWRKVRTLTAAFIFDYPVIGTLIRLTGQIPVFFTSTADGEFAVDAGKKGLTESLLREHFAEGGWLVVYPEGGLNPRPEQLMPFRLGGLQRIVEADAEVVTMVYHGAPGVWRRKSYFGGAPGTVRISVERLTARGARALVAGLRESCDYPSGGEMSDAQILADAARGLMQRQYDAMAEAAAAAQPE